MREQKNKWGERGRGDGVGREGIGKGKKMY
jgi:hypothetical protein